MVVGCIIAGRFVAWLAIELIRAPYGWQDADGFHLGEPPHNRSDQPTNGLTFRADDVRFHSQKVARP